VYLDRCLRGAVDSSGRRSSRRSRCCAAPEPVVLHYRSSRISMPERTPAPCVRGMDDVTAATRPPVLGTGKAKKTASAAGFETSRMHEARVTLMACGGENGGGPIARRGVVHGVTKRGGPQDRSSSGSSASRGRSGARGAEAVNPENRAEEANEPRRRRLPLPRATSLTDALDSAKAALARTTSPFRRATAAPRT